MRFFTLEKIAKQLPEVGAALYRATQPIPRFKFYEGECAGAHRPEFDDSAWADFNVGDFWGGYDVTAWFRARVPIPTEWRDKKLALRFLVGPRDGGDSTAETMLYVNGSPLQGIDVWHEEAWLPPEQVRAGKVTLALKAWSGVLGVPDRRRFKVAQLHWIDEPTESFYYLADTLLKAVKVMDENDLRRVRLLEALNAAFLRLDFTRPQSEAFYESVCAAEKFLWGEVCKWQGVEEIKPTVVGIGHAHIDLAWLWRLRHSREKAARTFATALHLMRQYPDYRFMHSSPQLYEYLKHDYPEIFARVKERIASREWEITGGMWIESDTNIPNGESLIRQFLLGRQSMRDEFGVEMNLLWLPDVFGYSYALPQIVKKCGLKYFMTTKMSWNQFNHLPYDTFRWRGVDGTELLTHFVTTPEENNPRWHTYNGQLRPSDVKGLWDNYQQKEVNDELLMLFGWGDGGGGPTKEMLEYARALKNLPGLPRVALGLAEPYFERLAQRVADKPLPVWDGELYFEYHRGTYTSQAYNKRANRLAEVLYHNAEWLSALAGVLASFNYPAQKLRQGWELILLNQFHDILPGSSIRSVYEDSQVDYEQIMQIGQSVLAEARQALLNQIGVGDESVVVFNSLSWTRDDLIELPGSGALAAQPSMQRLENGMALVLVSDLPALGYRALSLSDFSSRPGSLPAGEGARESPRNEFTITPRTLESPFYKIELNERGQLTSLLNKRHNREVLAPGVRANVLQAFEDKPMAFDAWDIDPYYQEKMREVGELIEAEVEESGPLRGVLRLRWRFNDSTMTQRLTLYAHSPRIDFRTTADWREQQILLKAAFPVGVRATRATYEIQFGSIERPTHWNTSWDWARFEVCGHKWVDLSEGDYGVALLNDCKYGHDVKDNVLRLTLIKSPIRPDPLADQGAHTFTYSLLPHAGDWRTGGVLREAYALNYPLLTHTIPAQPAGPLPARYSFAEVESDHVILETVKKAEREDAWVVRVYECQQRRSNAVSIHFGLPIRKAVECNLVEEGEQPISWQGARLTFAIAPYEIKTFKVSF